MIRTLARRVAELESHPRLPPPAPPPRDPLLAVLTDDELLALQEATLTAADPRAAPADRDRAEALAAELYAAAAERLNSHERN